MKAHKQNRHYVLSVWPGAQCRLRDGVYRVYRQDGAEPVSANTHAPIAWTMAAEIARNEQRRIAK